MNSPLAGNGFGGRGRAGTFLRYLGGGARDAQAKKNAAKRAGPHNGCHLQFHRWRSPEILSATARESSRDRAALPYIISFVASQPGDDAVPDRAAL